MNERQKRLNDAKKSSGAIGMIKTDTRKGKNWMKELSDEALREEYQGKWELIYVIGNCRAVDRQILSQLKQEIENRGYSIIEHVHTTFELVREY